MRTNNTDSLVIALGCKYLRFINVNNFYPELGETLCKALPAYHTLTGCNYTASFFKKDTAPQLKLLHKDTDAQIVLRELSTLEEIDENIISEIEGYLCKTHASKNICKVSDSQTHASEEI